MPLCRSELAREKPETATGNQIPRVIVEVFREQARSYKGRYAKSDRRQGVFHGLDLRIRSLLGELLCYLHL